MPLKVVTIDSPYAAEDVRRRLNLIVCPRLGFFGQRPRTVGGGGQEPEFHGRVQDDHFKITRIISYRNSFVPTIRGSVSPGTGGGTKIRLIMALHPLVALFMAGWVGVLGMALVVSISRHEGVAVPGILIVFGVVLTCGGFLYEARKAEEILRRWLGAA